MVLTDRLTTLQSDWRWYRLSARGVCRLGLDRHEVSKS